MFDLGWQEIIIVFIVAIIIVGPKDIPKLIVGFKKITRGLRNISIQVQSAFDDVVNDAEINLAKKEIDSFKSDIQSIDTEASEIVALANESIADLDKIDKSKDLPKFKAKTATINSKRQNKKGSKTKKKPIHKKKTK